MASTVCDNSPWALNLVRHGQASFGAADYDNLSDPDSKAGVCANTFARMANTLTWC